MSTKPNKPIEPLASVHTDSLTEIMTRLGASLLAGKVVVARVENGVLNTHFRAFETPMGLACDNGRIVS